MTLNKKTFRNVLSTLTVIVVAFIAAYLNRDVIVRSQIAPAFIRAAIVMFCPPNDYNDLILSEAIDVSAVGVPQSYMFSAKYERGHAVCILINSQNAPMLYHDSLLDKQRNPNLRLATPLAVEVRILGPDGVLFNINRNLSEVQQNNSIVEHEFVLAMLSVPDDIPRDATLTLELTVTLEDSHLNSQYGPLLLTIKGTSI